MGWWFAPEQRALCCQLPSAPPCSSPRLTPRPPTPTHCNTQSCRMAHLDRPYGDWPQAVTSVPADAMRLREHGRIGVGLPANLVVFRGRRYSELLSRPQHDRVSAGAWGVGGNTARGGWLAASVRAGLRAVI